ncbi:MAG: glucose/galactose MFS transporter, partial [Ferruginibacter sp.]|nr:glucose/galactose MFS transporter [Cytophagales bacterium]
ILGKPGGASSRLNIMGVCNSVAGIIAPLIFGFITLNNADQLKKELLTLPTAERLARLDELSSRVIIPYLIITLVLVGLATMVHFSGLPEIDTDAEDTSLGDQSRKTSVFQFRHLVLGIVAIFCYVGVEVMAVDTVVNFGTFQGFSFETAASFPAAVVLAMFFGRFAGIFVIGKRIAPSKALVLTASVGFGLALLAMFTQGYVSIGCLVLMGLCNSVMWPIIFPLAITGLGRFTKIGSSYLIMAIVGGAIIPLVYGRLADPDLLNRQAAYVVFLPCYIFLLYYGWRGYKTVASGQ